MSAAVELRGVVKRYRRTRALDGLDLRVPRGTLVGLVGPNGAGKTTTFGIISGVLEPDEGTVDVLGSGPFHPRAQAGALGVLPQDCALNPHSSARQLLTFFGRLQGLTRAEATREADRLLDELRLGDRATSRVGELSHGMKRRLAVAQALVGDPRLVLLDEPTGGLDPHLVVEMRELLLREKRRRTLVVSSHILSDLERTCDEIAFLEAGRCVRAEPVETLRLASRRIRIRLAGPAERAKLAAVFGDRPFDLDGDSLSYELAEDEAPRETAPAVLAALVAAGVPVLEVSVGGSLEEAYLAAREAVRRDPGRR